MNQTLSGGLREALAHSPWGCCTGSIWTGEFSQLLAKLNNALDLLVVSRSFDVDTGGAGRRRLVKSGGSKNSLVRTLGKVEREHTNSLEEAHYKNELRAFTHRNKDCTTV